MRLKDKVAIVTGGGVGIGKAYAHGLAKEGAKVVVADIQEAEAEKVAADIKQSGGEATAVPVDVTSFNKAQAMAQAAISAYGRIDILVNNAGLYSALKKKNFMEIDSDEWDRVMAVNVKGLFQSGLPRHETTGQRKDNQYLIRNNLERLAILSPLCVIQSWRDRLHSGAGTGGRRRQHLR